MSVVLQLRAVRRVYGRSRTALDGVSLSLEAGEVVALLGPSGSGKTTLVNVAAGLDRPTEGDVTVTGQPLGELGEAALARFRRQRIGVVTRSIDLLAGLTVLENVLLPAQLARADRRAADARARELLARLGIADAADLLPEELGAGDQQRAAIARALINRPSLVLADEPTGALDSAGGAEVLRLFEEVAAEEQASPAILVATHDAAVATASAQRVVRLLDGRVRQDVQLPPNLDRLRPHRAQHGANGTNGSNGHHANGLDGNGSSGRNGAAPDALRAPAAAPRKEDAPPANGVHRPEPSPPGL